MRFGLKSFEEAFAAAEVLSGIGDERFAELRSPLKYDRSAAVFRLSLIDASAPPAPEGDAYFSAVFKTKRANIYGADSGTIAFLDWHNEGSDEVYIDYIKTRRDHQRTGAASRLVEEFYKTNRRKMFVNWGKIMSDGAEKMFKDRRATESSTTRPQSIGKIGW